jgi:hypothetical protein
VLRLYFEDRRRGRFPLRHIDIDRDATPSVRIHD